MQKVLVVVDMQNDFIDGSLGTSEAVTIVPKVVEKIKGFDGVVLFTRDTHTEEYMTTQEAKYLPVAHCIKNTHGWNIQKDIEALRKTEPINKGTFGSVILGNKMVEMNEQNPIESITFVGLCTDICVISNAVLAKAFLPETQIIVDSSCCAGTTVESHNNALREMSACQITVVGDNNPKIC